MVYSGNMSDDEPKPQEGRFSTAPTITPDTEHDKRQTAAMKIIQVLGGDQNRLDQALYTNVKKRVQQAYDDLDQERQAEIQNDLQVMKQPQEENLVSDPVAQARRTAMQRTRSFLEESLSPDQIQAIFGYVPKNPSSASTPTYRPASGTPITPTK